MLPGAHFVDFRQLLVESLIRSIILGVWEALPVFGTVSNGSCSSNNGGLACRELLACVECRHPVIFVMILSLSGEPGVPKELVAGAPGPRILALLGVQSA